VHKLLLPIALLAAACNPSGGDDTFTSGEFAFQTIGVTDACFDGGFDVIFMPDGPNVPRDFGTEIFVPAEDELPSTYTISLQDPFNDMEITVTGAGDSRTVTGAENTGVELDGEAYPGCMVDMSIDISLTIVDADTVDGTAVLNTASFDEENCPAVDSDPCTITLDISGTRAN
jgi:hypothetical protein